MYEISAGPSHSAYQPPGRSVVSVASDSLVRRQTLASSAGAFGGLFKGDTRPKTRSFGSGSKRFGGFASGLDTERDCLARHAVGVSGHPEPLLLNL